VSSADQKADLQRQAGGVVNAATARGLTVSEIGSGLDGNRPRLAKLLRDQQDSAMVVEHRDRLARFGVERLTCALAAAGRGVVVDDAEVADDLVPDMVEVLTSFCACRYGRRWAARKAKAAMAAAQAAT
jgi:putative resolvase